MGVCTKKCTNTKEEWDIRNLYKVGIEQYRNNEVAYKKHCIIYKNNIYGKI